MGNFSTSNRKVEDAIEIAEEARESFVEPSNYLENEDNSELQNEDEEDKEDMEDFAKMRTSFVMHNNPGLYLSQDEVKKLELIEVEKYRKSQRLSTRFSRSSRLPRSFTKKFSLEKKKVIEYDLPSMKLHEFPIPVILNMMECINVELEEEEIVYPSTLFYGYFIKDKARTLHLIFCSFNLVSDLVNLRSIPFMRVKNIFFETPVLVNSKYLRDCKSVKSLMNFKVNKKSLLALENAYSTIEMLDFRIYNMKNDTLRCINKMRGLKYLKMNFRKKIANRMDITEKFVGRKLEVIEFWNTSNYQHICLPKSFFQSFFYLDNVKSVCLVRIKLNPKNLSKILSNTSLEEFEYLGRLTNSHFQKFENNKTLKSIILSGCELDDDYIKLFELKNVLHLNFSSARCNESALNYVLFSNKSNLSDINLNGLDIPLSFIDKVCKLPSLRNIHFERTKLSDYHLQMLNDKAEFRKTVNIYIMKDGDEFFFEELDKLEKRDKMRILTGDSVS